MTDPNLVDSYLALTRQALTPPAALRERVQARLEPAIVFQRPSVLEPLEAAPSPAVTARPFLRLSRGASLAASGALLALGFVGGLALRPGPSDEPPPPLPRVVETPGGTPAVPGWARLAAPSEAAPAEAASAGPETPPPHSRHRARASEPARLHAPGEELALLQRAERAVRAENAALALALTAELEARYPRSQLLEERSAIELMAYCVAHSSDARPRAERFLRDHARSVYAERITALCLEAVTPAAELR